jgi:DNA-binding MarR family transcriptional regulator
MNNKNEALIYDIVAGIRNLRRVVYHDYIRTGRQLGLTETQSDVLRTLLIHGEMSSADLSRNLYVTPANITGVIDRLEKKGLVARIRYQADRRVALISLTESGKGLSAQLPDPVENKLISGLLNLGQHQVQALDNAMNRIIGLIGAEKMGEIPLELNNELNAEGDE